MTFLLPRCRVFDSTSSNPLDDDADYDGRVLLLSWLGVMIAISFLRRAS